MSAPILVAGEALYDLVADAEGALAGLDAAGTASYGFYARGGGPRRRRRHDRRGRRVQRRGFLAWWSSHALGREDLARHELVVEAARFAAVVAARTVARAGASPPVLAADAPALLGVRSL